MQAVILYCKVICHLEMNLITILHYNAFWIQPPKRWSWSNRNVSIILRSTLACHVCSGVVSDFSAAHLNASAARRRNKRAAHSLPREWRRRRQAQRADGPIRAEPRRFPPSSPRSCCGWTEHSSFLGLRQQRIAATTRNEPKTRRFLTAHDTFEGHVRLFIKLFFKTFIQNVLKVCLFLTRFKWRWCFLSQVWGTGWRVRRGSSSGSPAK